MGDDRHVLRVVRTLPASPETVFEAWTSRKFLERWICPDPGAHVHAEIDLRAGGRYSIRMETADGPFTVFGTYLDVGAPYRPVEPPYRLVFTWDWKEEPHEMRTDTLVKVDFVAVEGGTEIRLIHEGFPASSARDGHEQGWGISLDRLADRVHR